MFLNLANKKCHVNNIWLIVLLLSTFKRIFILDGYFGLSKDSDSELPNTPLDDDSYENDCEVCFKLQTFHRYYLCILFNRVPKFERI